MNNKEFAQKARDIASNYSTVYLWGTFGAPLSYDLIRQKAQQYPKNYSAGRQTYLRGIAPNKPWAFDCVGLIKGILWGWKGDPTKSFGGATYGANNVPDVNASGVEEKAYDKKTSMSDLQEGEVVYKNGHVGIYVGDGQVAEATLTGKYDGVVITSLSQGNWRGHGKLPWVTYESSEPTESPATPPAPPAEKKPPQVGDTVQFKGGKHYISSNGSLGFSARSGPARITRYLKGKKHPYHLIHTDKTSNVYGWVNEDTVL